MMAALCTICQDHLTEDPQDPVALKCGHIFHRECLLKWFESDGGVCRLMVKCPSCNHFNRVSKVLKVYLTEDGAIEKLKEVESKLKDARKQIADIESKYGRESEEHAMLKQEHQIKLKDMEGMASNMKELTEQLANLQSEYEEEMEDHSLLKQEHRDLMEEVYGVLEKIGGNNNGKGATKAEMVAALLKISNAVNSHDGAADEYGKVDDNGNAVLAYAILRKRPVEQLHNLVWLGADWRQINYSGQSALHIAAGSGTPAALQFFLELGAEELDVNGLDEKWKSPLHLALENEKDEGELLEKCKLLIGKGADTGIMDKDGNTPYMIAEQHQAKDELVKVMENNNNNNNSYRVSRESNVEGVLKKIVNDRF